MSEAIVNLTAILVNREIEDFLALCPEKSPYRILFIRPYFRQRLTAKILSQIPNRHVVVGDTYALSNHDNYLLSSLEEKLTIERLIKKAIPRILIENSQQVGEILVQENFKTNPCLIGEETYNYN